MSKGITVNEYAEAVAGLLENATSIRSLGGGAHAITEFVYVMYDHSGRALEFISSWGTKFNVPVPAGEMNWDVLHSSVVNTIKSTIGPTIKHDDEHYAYSSKRTVPTKTGSNTVYKIDPVLMFITNIQCQPGCEEITESAYITYMLQKYAINLPGILVHASSKIDKPHLEIEYAFNTCGETKRIDYMDIL